MSSRSAQVAAALLAFLLIALIGATIFILLSRPSAPGPTPTPTAVATLPSFEPFPSPTATTTFATLPPTPTPTPTGTIPPTPTLVPTPPPTDTPSPEPTITPTPSPSPTPSPTPSPSPTVPPTTAPGREVTVVDFGVDPKSDLMAVQRTIAFSQDGPGMISAQLKGVDSGKVRMCLRGGGTPQQCITAHAGTLSRVVFDAGETNWTVTLLGTAPGQFASVTLEFNALSPDILLDSFRFNGTNDAHNNGVQVVFGTIADGTVELRGQIDDGNDTPYPWHFNLAVDDVTTSDQSGGPATNFDVTAPVSAGTAYTLIFEEPEATTTGAFPVFLSNVHLTYP